MSLPLRHGVSGRYTASPAYLSRGCLIQECYVSHRPDTGFWSWSILGHFDSGLNLEISSLIGPAYEKAIAEKRIYACRTALNRWWFTWTADRAGAWVGYVSSSLEDVASWYIVQRIVQGRPEYV